MSGFPVFPVEPRGKAPLVKGWRQSATTDARRVEATWRRTPNANIGVACGGGLLVLDLDGPEALDAVAALALPPTPTVGTARGEHRYFRGAARNRVAVLPGLDVRGSGGYVVGAGSVHKTGATYEWIVSPTEVPLADAPRELLALVASKARKESVATTIALAGRIVEGDRNSTLFRFACSLRARYALPEGVVAAAALAFNAQRCAPPLPESEVRRLVRSAATYDEPPLWAVDPIRYACSGPPITPAARLLLMGLARHANVEGMCFPGVRRLREVTGLASDTQRKARDILVAVPRVDVTKQGRGFAYRLLSLDETDQRRDQGSGSYVLGGRTLGGAR